MRYMFGILFLALGLSLISSIIEFKPHPGSYGLKYIMENAGNIITGHLKIYSGLTGALLLCLFQFIIRLFWNLCHGTTVFCASYLNAWL